MNHKVCFLVNNRIYISEEIRSALGLAVENISSHSYIFHEKMPTKTEYLQENITWIRDIGGEVCSVTETMDDEVKEYNLKEFGLPEASLDDVVEKILESDFIVGFGLPAQKVQTPSQCE